MELLEMTHEQSGQGRLAPSFLAIGVVTETARCSGGYRRGRSLLGDIDERSLRVRVSRTAEAMKSAATTTSEGSRSGSWPLMGWQVFLRIRITTSK
jgi:hypothetical protein